MVTSYVVDMREHAKGVGLDDDLRQLADDDAQLLERLGVQDERERNLVFYLEHFFPELEQEFGLPTPLDRTKAIAKAFSDLRGIDNIDLTDIRSACRRALGQGKKAYPNTAGVMEINRKPERDVSKWVKTLGEIHAAKHMGVGESDAMRNLTEEWDPVEKQDFEQWLRYYERGDQEKYASGTFQAPEAPTMPPIVTQPRGRTRVENRSLEDNKKALISRLDSAKRLLRLFAPPVWPRENWNSVYRALSDLEQEITGLRTIASMRDRIVRTARLLDKAGFADGADTLRKIAQPPDDDVTSQIEKALTGREYDIKPGATPPVDLPPPLPPPPAGDEGTMPPPAAPSALTETEAPTGAPPEAMEPLPEPPPAPGPELEKKPAKEENPYAGSTAMDVLETLEPLMKRFKEREIVRQLSKVDMMMDALNIVAYFPELGEAIGRLIETDSYVGARLEKIIGKLRGGLKEGESEEKKPVPPSVDMGPTPVEETAATVSEKAPAMPMPEAPKPAPAEETAVTVSEKAPKAPGA